MRLQVAMAEYERRAPSAAFVTDRNGRKRPANPFEVRRLRRELAQKPKNVRKANT